MRRSTSIAFSASSFSAFARASSRPASRDSAFCRRVLRGGARGLQSRVQVVPARDGLVALALDCRECLPREFKLLLRFRETILRHDDLLGTLRVLLVARRELGLELGDACGLVLRCGSPRRSLARRL
jgi:hypothetical protein